MKYFIKIWPDNTAILVSNHGNTVTVFDSLEDAQLALRHLTSNEALFDINPSPCLQETTRSAA